MKQTIIFFRFFFTFVIKHENVLCTFFIFCFHQKTIKASTNNTKTDGKDGVGKVKKETRRKEDLDKYKEKLQPTGYQNPLNELDCSFKIV